MESIECGLKRRRNAFEKCFEESINFLADVLAVKMKYSIGDSLDPKNDFWCCDLNKHSKKFLLEMLTSARKYSDS